MRVQRRAIELVSVLLMLTLVLLGCESPRITGSIRDNFGNPVKDAKVSLEGTQWTALSNEKGEFQLEFEPGEFKLAISAVDHVGSSQPLKIFKKARFPLAPIVMPRIPPGDGLRLSTRTDYAAIKAQQLRQSRRSLGQFQGTCTDLHLVGDPPRVEANGFLAFTPSAPGGNLALLRPRRGVLPGRGGAFSDRECGAPDVVRGLTWTEVIRGKQWMLAGQLADGVYCLVAVSGGQVENHYVDSDAACFVWRTAAR